MSKYHVIITEHDYNIASFDCESYQINHVSLVLNFGEDECSLALCKLDHFQILTEKEWNIARNHPFNQDINAIIFRRGDILKLMEGEEDDHTN